MAFLSKQSSPGGIAAEESRVFLSDVTGWMETLIDKKILGAEELKCEHACAHTHDTTVFQALR